MSPSSSVPSQLSRKAADEAAELADDHLARVIGNQRKGVALLANTGRHRSAHQRCIHFDAGIAQRVLDNVERDRINDSSFRTGCGWSG